MHSEMRTSGGENAQDSQATLLPDSDFIFIADMRSLARRLWLSVGSEGGTGLPSCSSAQAMRLVSCEG